MILHIAYACRSPAVQVRDPRGDGRRRRRHGRGGGRRRPDAAGAAKVRDPRRQTLPSLSTTLLHHIMGYSPGTFSFSTTTYVL